MQDVFLKKENWIGTLPRKFNTSITSSITNRCNVYGHDVCFVLAVKDGVYGYNVYVGGKVGVIAKNCDIFLRTDEVVDFYEKLIKFYKEYGFKDNRNKNRLYFLIEEIGIKNFKIALQEYMQIEFENSGETLTKMEHFDNNQGSIQLKNGSFALHAIVPGGIFSGSDLIEVSQIAQENNGDIRLSVEQNLYITNIKDKEKVLKEKFFQKYKNVDSPFFNNLVACAGKKECSYGVIPNKPDAIELSSYLTKKLDLKNTKIRIYWSGCVKGCGLHEWGDIGFVGAKAKYQGKVVDGVDILLGGSLTNPRGAKTILKAVPLSLAKYLIKELLLEFSKNRLENEHFESFYNRFFSKYSKGAIAFLMLFNTLLNKFKIEYKFSLAKHKPIGHFEPFEIFDFGNEIYRNLTTQKAYLEVYNFIPVGSGKPDLPHKINSNIPVEVSEIVYKMISPKNRYQVFSEIFIDILKLL